MLFHEDSLSPPLLFGLVGFYHVPSPAMISLPFHFIYIVVLGTLPAGCRIIFLLHYGVCSLRVGLSQWLVKFSWLGKCVLVAGAVSHLISLEGNAMSSSAFWGVYGGLVWLCKACLLMLRFVFMFCWRITIGCLVLEHAGS